MQSSENNSFPFTSIRYLRLPVGDNPAKQFPVICNVVVSPANEGKGVRYGEVFYLNEGHITCKTDAIRCKLW